MKLNRMTKSYVQLIVLSSIIYSYAKRAQVDLFASAILCVFKYALIEIHICIPATVLLQRFGFVYGLVSIIQHICTHTILV